MNNMVNILGGTGFIVKRFSELNPNSVLNTKNDC